MERINLWSSPRNISTALMYSFAQRKDFEVVDEPLYAHYLNARPEQQLRHPAAEEVLKSQSKEGRKVLQDFLNQEVREKHLLLKQMTHHLVDIPHSDLLDFTNILLIRPPERIIFSYQKVISKPDIDDIGIKAQAELFEFLHSNKQTPIVLDTHELLKAPKKVLRMLFEKIGLDFDPSVLSWKAGPRKEDGVWAKHWYSNVHSSTGFQALSKKEITINKDLIPLLDKCNDIYKLLFQHAIKA